MFWYWNGSSDCAHPELIYDIHNVVLVQAKHFNYFVVRISYDNCSIGDKEIEARLASTRDSFVFNNTTQFLNNLFKFSFSCQLYTYHCF